MDADTKLCRVHATLTKAAKGIYRTPAMAAGLTDHVWTVADLVALLDQKRYFRHTGYMGLERFTAAKSVFEKYPERVIDRAVWGMLPKTTLSRQKVKQMLKVYAGPTHPHAAQRPEPLGAAEAR